MAQIILFQIVHTHTFIGEIKVENGNVDFSPDSRKKKSSSANSSPYKDKKRRKLCDEPIVEQQQLALTNHDRFDAPLLPPPIMKPVVTKIYYSYFERTNDDHDEMKEMK